MNHFIRLVLLAGCTATSQLLPAQHADAVQAPRIARELMQEALLNAKSEHKGVLVKFSASWCGPCQEFDRFLNDTTGVGAIMRRHFEIVALTTLEFAAKAALNNPGAVELSREMGGDLATTGIPYFFMLDGAGRKLGDSRSMPDNTNIGYPQTAAEVVSFDKLLIQTAPSMTAAERTRIRTFLDKAAGRS